MLQPIDETSKDFPQIATEKPTKTVYISRAKAIDDYSSDDDNSSIDDPSKTDLKALDAEFVAEIANDNQKQTPRYSTQNHTSKKIMPKKAGKTKKGSKSSSSKKPRKSLKKKAKGNTKSAKKSKALTASAKKNKARISNAHKKLKKITNQLSKLEKLVT